MLCLLMSTALTACQSLGRPTAVGALQPLRTIEILDADGGSRSIGLFESHGRARLSDGAQSMSLPVSAAHVIGFGWVPPGLAAQAAAAPASLMALSGVHRSEGFIPESVDLVDENPLPPVAGRAGLPLYAPALPRLQAELFGSEGRARLVGSLPHGLDLICSDGAAPAGVLLRGALDDTLRQRNAALRLRVRGKGRFTLLVADGARAAAEDPLAIGELVAGPDWTRVDLTLPLQSWQPADWQALTLACPAQAARLELDSLEVVLADRAAVPGSRALWVWNPLAWRDDGAGLLGHVRASGGRELFISVPLADEKCLGAACRVADPEPLAGFLAQAAQSGIAVWVVAGDPRAVLPEEREAWRGRASAYARFNAGQADRARLAGIQYDIEAYLVPGYQQSPEAWNQRYLDLLQDLRGVGGDLAVDLVVPWWFGQGGNSPPQLLEALAPLADRLTVMDYRTDAGQIVQSALPFLEWAQRWQRDVRIGLESGPLPDQEWRRYARAPRGELWLFRLDRQDLFALLDTPADGEAPAQVFAARGGHLIRAGQTTFFERPDALWRMVAQLEDVFGTTRAFAGVAIHGLDHAWY